MDRTPSADALDAWCDAERGRAAGLAAALKVSATTINHYRRGVITPAAKANDDKQRAIQEHTGGAVLASGWLAPPTINSSATDTIPDSPPVHGDERATRAHGASTSRPSATRAA